MLSRSGPRSMRDLARPDGRAGPRSPGARARETPARIVAGRIRSRGVELSHHGGDCTFETTLRHFELDNAVLWDMARILHEADLADDPRARPKTDRIACRRVPSLV